jgi:hypothetical protein
MRSRTRSAPIRVGLSPTPRDPEADRAQGGSGRQGDDGTIGRRLDAEVGSHGLEHPLRVIPGRPPFHNGDGRPAREPRQQHGRLHLCAGPAVHDPDRLERAVAAHPDGEPIGLSELLEPGSGLGQRLGHPSHGASTERRIAGDDGLHLPASREEPEEETSRRAAVPAVQVRVRSQKTLGPQPRNGQGVQRSSGQSGAQRPQRVTRGPGVGRVQKPVQPALALRQGRQDQRPVGDGLVARDPDIDGDPAHSGSASGYGISSSIPSRATVAPGKMARASLSSTVGSTP